MASDPPSDSTGGDNPAVGLSDSDNEANQSSLQFVFQAFPNTQTIAPGPSTGTIPAFSTHASSSNATSTFGSRFQIQNKPSVSYRKAPDLTSDPGQIFAPMTNVSQDFRNTTMSSTQPRMVSASNGDDTDGDDGPAPKRPRLDPAQASHKKFRQPIPGDVWGIILRNSHPGALLTMNMLCGALTDILKADNIWKVARQRVMGTEMPDPVRGLSEQRWASLWFGRGCDLRRSVCGKTVTRKRFWPFMVRLCDDCFRRQTQKDEFLDDSMGKYTYVGSLIAGGLTQGGKFVGTSTTLPDENWTNDSHTDIVFLRSDVRKIKTEYSALVNDPSATPEVVKAWIEGKRAEAIAFMARCSEIEKFERDFVASQPRHREARRKFFADQAAAMDPPLSKEALELMVPFKKALESNRKPSQQGWQTLEAKLIPIQPAAEELHRLMRDQARYMADQLNYRTPLADKFVPADVITYRSIRQHRTGMKDPAEIEHVLALARAELTYWTSIGCADADLVLLVLNGVYHRHADHKAAATAPQGLNTDGTRGVYELSMEDANMILHRVIEPAVRPWNDPARMRKALESFKCMACPRKDCVTRYNFVALFNHIYERHVSQVNQDDEYHTIYRVFDNNSSFGITQFPFYSVPWPQKLPIAADHHEVSRTTFWKSDSTDDYQLAPPPAVSVFSDRTLHLDPSLTHENFAGNMDYAASMLRMTTLEPLLQFKIAFLYALDHYTASGKTEELSLDVLKDWFDRLQPENALFAKSIFRCRVCHHDDSIATHKSRSKPENLSKAISHFETAHSDESFDWRNDLIDFPSHEEISATIKENDAKLKSQLAAAEERNATLAKFPHKKPDPNLKILQDKLSAMDILGLLFPLLSPVTNGNAGEEDAGAGAENANDEDGGSLFFN